jgi:thiamine-phosphate pyrophosphorylase
MRRAIPAPCLCLVTDLAVCGSLDALVRRVEAGVRGGVNMVQLRARELSGGELLELAFLLKKVCGQRALLFVNERVDVALACGADGVQLGEKALPLQAARELAGRRLLIGRSVHSTDSATEAANVGADILTVGTIFATASHPDVRPAGVGLICRIRERVSLPLIGIGGIEVSNAAQVMEAGATGVAVIRSILAAPDPEQAARALWQAINQRRGEGGDSD